MMDILRYSDIKVYESDGACCITLAPHVGYWGGSSYQISVDCVFFLGISVIQYGEFFMVEYDPECDE